MTFLKLSGGCDQSVISIFVCVKCESSKAKGTLFVSFLDNREHPLSYGMRGIACSHRCMFEVCDRTLRLGNVGN